MRVVDPEALLNEIQARYAEASQESRALEQDEDDVEIVARAKGETQAWAAAGGLVQAHIKAAPEVPSPQPIGPDTPVGTRILVWWREKWHIASFHTDCPGCPGESCPHCYGASEDYWRDGNGEIHEGMDEDWPTLYLPLPAAPAEAVS